MSASHRAVSKPSPKGARLGAPGWRCLLALTWESLKLRTDGCRFLIYAVRSATFHESGQSHFIIFSCHQWPPKFISSETHDPCIQCPEDMRRRFTMRIYGYV